MIKEILLLIVLILCNGVFAASEIAFLSIDKYDLKQKVKEKKKRAIKLQKLVEDPSNFLATIQIGITLAGFLASAFAAETFADYLVTHLAITSIGYATLKSIVVVIVTIILSYFTLVFGELVPKRFALAYPDKIAYFMVGIISVLMKITYPFVWILTKSTNVVARLFGVHQQEEDRLTEEEIKKIIATGKDEGAIESAEKDLIFKIFEFNDTSVATAMTKKEQTVMIPIDVSPKELLQRIKEHKFTRIPVYEGDPNHVIGILNVKALLISYSKTATLDLKSIIYLPTFVQAEEKIDDVFHQMQRERCNIVIVQNKKQEMVGILTMEDAVEEIVGNIYDEYDEIEKE